MIFLVGGATKPHRQAPLAQAVCGRPWQPHVHYCSCPSFFTTSSWPGHNCFRGSSSWSTSEQRRRLIHSSCPACLFKKLIALSHSTALCDLSYHVSMIAIRSSFLCRDASTGLSAVLPSYRSLLDCLWDRYWGFLVLHPKVTVFPAFSLSLKSTSPPPVKFSLKLC